MLLSTIHGAVGGQVSINPLDKGSEGAAQEEGDVWKEIFVKKKKEQ